MFKVEDNFSSSKEINIHKLEKYLRFLLVELNRYKEDWEITKDEFQIFKNEFNRFKQIIKLSDNIPKQIKEAIDKLSFNGRTKAKVSKYIFRYLFLWDATAYRLNQIEDKDIIETVEYDIRKILTELMLH